MAINFWQVLGTIQKNWLANFWSPSLATKGNQKLATKFFDHCPKISNSDQIFLGNDKNILIISSMVTINQMTKRFLKTPKTFWVGQKKIRSFDLATES